MWVPYGILWWYFFITNNCRGSIAEESHNTSAILNISGSAQVSVLQIRDGVFFSAFLIPGSGMEKNLDPYLASGMNIPGHVSESLELFFLLKILKFFDVDPDPRSGISLTLDLGPG